MKQAALFAHYGELQAEASRQVANIELLLENREAIAYRNMRDQAVAAGEKAPSDAALTKMIVLDPKVRAAKIALNEAKQIESICKTTVEAFKQKRDMLVQHGASEREERKGEMRLKGPGSEVESAARRVQERLSS
jgi:hypothetical protein